MNHTELKLWIINVAVITVTFAQIENTLKLISLLICIGYSIDKWIKLRKTKNDETE